MELYTKWKLAFAASALALLIMAGGAVYAHTYDPVPTLAVMFAVAVAIGTVGRRAARQFWLKRVLGFKEGDTEETRSYNATTRGRGTSRRSCYASCARRRLPSQSWWWATSTNLGATGGCCFPLWLVGFPRDLTGMFRRRISWDDGTVREALAGGEVAFLMNDCCRGGEDVDARAPSVGKGWSSAAHLSTPCPHGR